MTRSALDMGKYLGLFLRRGSPLVGPETFEEMVAPRVSLPHVPAPFSDASQGSYGYGLMVQPFFGTTLIGHGGSVLVYTAYFGFLPQQKLGVAVLANGSGYPCGQVAQTALAWAMDVSLSEPSCLKVEEIGGAAWGDLRHLP